MGGKLNAVLCMTYDCCMMVHNWLQETYGMSPHKDTQQASAARQELSIMRQEYQQAMDAEQRQHAPQQLHQGQEQKPPQVDPAELDSLYDLE